MIIEQGKYYRSENGAIYKILSQDSYDLWIASRVTKLPIAPPVVVTDNWGRNRFHHDLIEEVNYVEA